MSFCLSISLMWSTRVFIISFTWTTDRCSDVSSTSPSTLERTTPTQEQRVGTQPVCHNHVFHSCVITTTLMVPCLFGLWKLSDIYLNPLESFLCCMWLLTPFFSCFFGYVDLCFRKIKKKSLYFYKIWCVKYANPMSFCVLRDTEMGLSVYAVMVGFLQQTQVWCLCLYRWAVQRKIYYELVASVHPSRELLFPGKKLLLSPSLPPG